MQWLFIALLVIDLASVRNEPNLEKRSDLALDCANAALDRARDAANAGDVAKMATAFEEAGQSVDLAYDSLVESGKDPRHSRYFKKAELRTRDLLRRLEGLGQTVSFEDRALIDRLRDRVAEVHDNLLNGVLSKKKK
jgi:isopentenyl diphosphate isomerase/L-lactate dehydrogenase-like FMN-dependent dehydrogenase